MSLNELDIPNKSDINLKEILWTLSRYKYSIIFFTIIFTIISIFYAYFKIDVYQTSVTIEIGIENRVAKVGAGSLTDVIDVATSRGMISPDTEIAIIKSRFLISKALDIVDFRHRYYTTKNFKERELYNKSPITVDMKNGEGISFFVENIDKNKFRLISSGIYIANGKEWSYNKIHKYKEKISTDNFELILYRNTKKKFNNRCRFVVLSEKNALASVLNRVNAYIYGSFSRIVTINYNDNIALRAKEFTNALAKVYINQSIEKKNREASKTLKFVAKELTKINKELKQSELKLQYFKKKKNSIRLDTKVNLLLNKLERLKTERSKLLIDIGITNALYKNIKSSNNLSKIFISSLRNEVLINSIGKLKSSLVKLESLRVDYTDEYDKVKRLKSEIKQLKNNILNSVIGIRKNQKSRKKFIDLSIKKENKIINALPKEERELGELTRQFKLNEKIYSYLLEKKANVTISKASTVSNSRILDLAMLPKYPSKPKRKLIILTGIFLGLLFAIGLALLRAFLDDRVKYEEDISKESDIPLIGTIPHIREEDNNKIVVSSSPKSIIAEAFRNIRTNINFILKTNNSHIIAVTSTIGNEGKTTICSNLAGIMAMSGKKTIILNVDMRKPTLHHKFNISNDKGMSTLLSYNNTLAEVIQSTEYENIDIIPSGPKPPNPSELIQDEFMEKVLMKLKEVYDVVIVDTPPVGLVTDARMLIHLADITIYVVRAEFSKKAFLKNLEKISIFKNVKGLGVLLNDVKEDKNGYGYGYKYKYNYYEEK